jgi:MFS family permease
VTSAVTAAASAAGSGRRRALGALCVTEVVSYGALYYAFPVLAGAITADTGWSRTAITGAFSAGNLVGAVAGIPVGRLLERHGPRPVMTAGSLLATGALVAVALAPGLGAFLAAWLLAGVAMACVFYPPAFAALTGWYGTDRVRALTTLTLVAGFASTVFAPLAAALVDHLSWRSSYLVLAGLLALTTVPLHALALRLPWPRPDHDRPVVPGGTRVVVTSRTFLVLVGAMTLAALAQFAVVVTVVPLLTGRGLSATTAAWALGLGGAGQVAGRLCYRRLDARTSPRGRTALVMLAGSVAALLLAVVPGPAVVLLAASVLAGAVRGLFTLLQATLVSDVWGPERFASLNGVFNAPLTAANALAPSAGVAAAGALGSYPRLFLALAATGVVAAAVAGRGAADRSARRPVSTGQDAEEREDHPAGERGAGRAVGPQQPGDGAGGEVGEQPGRAQDQQGRRDVAGLRTRRRRP